MNSTLSRYVLALVAPMLVAACGGSGKQPAAGAPSAAPSADPTPTAATDTSAPAASATASATAAAVAPKPATAAEAAAACTTTAKYDKKEPNKLTFEVKNTSDREVRMCWLEFYLYDKAGKQLAHVTLPYNFKIAPGASDGQPYEFTDLAKQIGGKAVATIETAIPTAKFTDGAEFSDTSLAPAERPRSAKK